MVTRLFQTSIAVFLVLITSGVAIADDALRVAVFDIDASPPVGSPLAYDPTKEVETPLSCRGIVLLGGGKPIVLSAVDWIGIGNDGQREFKEALAKAAGTTADRVAIHTLHQHDAPWCDFSVDELLEKHKITHRPFDSPFARDVIRRLQPAVKQAIEKARPVTHVGLSSAEVKHVASNRRILGADGKVAYVRYTATKDAKIREFPEGTIDPLLRMVTLWNNDEPLVALTYYATHPQSYYRTGKANADFPGLAREARQKATGVPHVHFNGAGGNIGAGKYNDGSPANRQVLADRMTDAKERAWTSTKKSPIAAKDVSWTTVAVALPPAARLDEEALLAAVNDEALTAQERFIAATKLVWLRRCMAGKKIDLACLALGDARILHMPGELFVEYQLEAQRLRPNRFVAMAAYGDYAPAYIGTAISYAQGGYETQPNSSFVAPEVEGVLMQGIARLLDADPQQIRPLR
jgi:hypothetical protein